jgi:hypothetical protein
MKLFKSEKQEIRFYIIGTIIAISAHIILSIIRQLQ